MLRALAVGLLLWIASSGCASSGARKVGADRWYPAVEAGRPLTSVYEGRVPCARPELVGCEKVKVGLAIYGDPGTGEPAAYRLARIFVAEEPEGVRAVFAGALTVARGTSEDAGARVYELDANAPPDLRVFWVIGRDILFILDDDRRPRVGTAGWSYCLNRVW